MRKFKAAMIGCGRIAIDRHLPSLMSNSNISVRAICDINEERANYIAKKNKIPKYYTNFSDLLEREKDIDIIDIATPIKTHAPIAIDALKHDKHVILEKPMATSIEECEDIIKIARNNRLKVTVYHTMKIYPVINVVKKWIENNEIGLPYFTSFLTSYGELQPWIKNNGGVLWEIGPHRIYIILSLLGKIEKIENLIIHDTNKNPDIGDIKNLEIIMNTERGVVELHLLNSGFDTSPDLINIYGDKGMIKMSPITNSAYIFKSDRYYKWNSTFSDSIKSDLSIASQTFKRGLSYILRKTKILPHSIILDNFIDSIQTNEKLLVPPEEGLETVKILKKIEEKLLEI